MTDTDLEWRQMQEVWNTPDRESDARVAALRHAVAQQARRLRLALAGEVALTVAALASLAFVWLQAPGLQAAIVIGAALVHTIVIWAFALKNRRGHWNPRADTVRDAVAARRAHCHRRLAALRFVVGLSAVEGALMVLVLVMSDAARLPILFVMAFLGGAVLWTRWDGARLRRELAALDAFSVELNNSI